MKSEQILQKPANKNMVQWNQKDFHKWLKDNCDYINDSDYLYNEEIYSRYDLWYKFTTEIM
jgi:hypothetical protein